jgi:hypothetical protein
MSERDWEEEKRTVLGRLFDAAFGRREATEEEMGATSIGSARSTSISTKTTSGSAQ